MLISSLYIWEPLKMYETFFFYNINSNYTQSICACTVWWKLQKRIYQISQFVCMPLYIIDILSTIWRVCFWKIRFLFVLANKSKTRPEGSYKSPLIWFCCVSNNYICRRCCCSTRHRVVGFSYGCKRLTCQMISQ